MKKAIFFLLICIGFLSATAFVNFIPAFSLRAAGMTPLPSDHFTIYYEAQDEDAAKDIAQRLIDGYDVVAKAIALNPQYKTEIYIYKNLAELHRKKYGLVGAIFGPEWYIGDNVTNKVLLVSPKAPGKAHNYESVANAALHEYVHTLMWSVNPKLNKFLNEGMAGYLSNNTKPNYKLNNIPSFKDTKISNPIAFGNKGLYPVSYTYIEYLDKTYGMEKIMQLVKTENYNSVFSKSEQEIYDDWIMFYKANYIE